MSDIINLGAKKNLFVSDIVGSNNIRKIDKLNSIIEGGNKWIILLKWMLPKGILTKQMKEVLLEEKHINEDWLLEKGCLWKNSNSSKYKS